MEIKEIEQLQLADEIINNFSSTGFCVGCGINISKAEKHDDFCPLIKYQNLKNDLKKNQINPIEHNLKLINEKIDSLQNQMHVMGSLCYTSSSIAEAILAIVSKKIN